MAHELPTDAVLSIDDGRGRFVPVITIHGTMDEVAAAELARAMSRHMADCAARRRYERSLDSLLDTHRRYDVGHEIKLFERERSDHR
jgi:hypothetical protein